METNALRQRIEALYTEETLYPLAPALPEDATKAGELLTRIFGKWRNRIRTIALSTPDVSPLRLADYVAFSRQESTLASYLKRHFGELKPDGSTEDPVGSLTQTIFEHAMGVKMVSPGLPDELVRDIADNTVLPLVYAGALLKRPDCGDDVIALCELCEMLPRIVVLCRTESFGSGLRRWVAVTR